MKKYQNLSDIQLGLLMPLIGKLSCHVREQVSRVYKSMGYDLTPEAVDTLKIIHHFDGISQKKLVQILGKDKASVTRLLNTLVKSDLVERIQDEADRRIVRVHLTRAGKKAFQDIFPELQALSSNILSPITQEEFEAMIRSLATIVDNLPCQPESSPK